jgi:phthiocerol/phenolphthiocerol synthesis type-I polyketide synthase E
LGLFAIGYALGRQLGEWGVRPAAMLGNSIGEYAPAALAGVWSPADAAGLVYERARAIWAAEPGRMVAVSAPADEVTRRLGTEGEIAISVYGRGGVVLSGPRAAMDDLLAGDVLHDMEVRPLNVDRPGHCALMRPVAETLRAVVAATPAQPPRVPLVSNATGDWADPDAVSGPDYWAEQLYRPVLLDAGMATLLRSGCTTFVELGPGSSMLGALRWSDDWDGSAATVPMLGRSEDGELGLLRALGSLWELGVDAPEVTAPADRDGAERPLSCSLPPHPFAAEDPETERSARPVDAAPERRAPVVTSAQEIRPTLERLWCKALGVPSAADGDNFFALGGESLTLVNLIGRVREQVALTVSVAEFARSATFGRLVELAERARATDAPRPAVGVVTLREGTGRPVFLAADAAGTALSYQALADQLDGDRPVHGLEPDPAAGRLSVEDVAAQHVAAVLRTQPSGPYTIGGWSFGAVVAHEMAAQLTDRGARVDLLLCLDAFVPGRAGVPIAFDAEFLGSHLGLQVGAALGIGTVGRQARRNPELRRLLRDKFRVLLPYRPKPAPCRTVVFKVGVDARAAARLGGRLAGLYRGGVRVRPVDGDHWSMLAQPHVRDLAGKLREVLTEPAEHAPETAPATATTGEQGV